MTIYFDENKQAFAFEITNPLATIDDETWANYAGTDKWDIVDSKFTDISNTDEYKAKIQAIENSEKKTELQSQIDELDKKRIRAIAEPELKDATSGQTWLEYYTEQIKTLRLQIAAL